MQREVRLKETGYRCSTPASTPAHMIAPSIKPLAFGTVFGELKSSNSIVFLYILKNNMLFFLNKKYLTLLDTHTTAVGCSRWLGFVCFLCTVCRLRMSLPPPSMVPRRLNWLVNL